MLAVKRAWAVKPVLVAKRAWAVSVPVAAGMGGDAESINYTGVAADWLADGISQAYTVCVYETENCTTTDEEGNFTLENVAANAEVLFTMVGEDNARIAFPVVTGAEDTTNTRPFTVVTRALADIMVASVPTENGGGRHEEHLDLLCRHR